MRLLNRTTAFLLTPLLLISAQLLAQDISQTVKGNISDEDSHAPIIGANVIIIGSDPIKGASTDLEGNFVIPNVEIGRLSLVISSIGYEEQLAQNILVQAGKETIINLRLKESIVKLDEIVVKPEVDRTESLNEMVLVSARQFSVEETKRYAGTFNDPARMVTAFAGIQGNAEGSNHIVVRGNSPNNVKWRMEGIEIPNPNHFSEEGSSGGAINALNSAMLSNSDFYSGAFSADYGDVLAGVFDMRMRTGNRDKREYSVGVGILGTDITLEGPFKNGGRSSYLANYRYSTLALLDDMGVVDFGGVPKYQDLAFKFAFPTTNSGLFTVFGIGGKSKIMDEVTDEETEEVLGTNDFNASLGTLNLKHLYFFNEDISLESYLSISENSSGDVYEEREEDTGDLELNYTNDLSKITFRGGTILNTKLNARSTVKTSVAYNRFSYSFMNRERNADGDIFTRLDDDGDAGLLAAYANLKHRFTDRTTLSAGMHYMRFLLNDSQVLEPRVSLKYKASPTCSLFAGIGFHSQIAPLTAYYSVQEDGTRPNLEMDFMKAIHYVAGVDKMLGPNLLLKAEVYYQDLYNIPVEDDPQSSYSILNEVDGFIERSLVNEGTGHNYGLELTLEKYFTNNLYYLVTASLYSSKYTALDGIERDTRFNGNFLSNFLIGKEFYLGSGTNKTLSINTRLTWTGARKITPIFLDESNEAGWPIYDEANAWTKSGDDVFKLDFSVAYSWNKPKTRQEIKLDLQNATGNDAIIDQYYDSANGSIESSTQLPMFPVLIYTLEF